MMCDVIECKYNSSKGRIRDWYNCLFNKKAKNCGQLEFTKVVDEIGNTQRDKDGRPILVCESFLARMK